MKLTRHRYFLLQLTAHAGLVLILIYGSFYQIMLSVLIAITILIFGSTITYHRLLSHRSWNAPRWFEVFGTILGIFSFTGSSISRTLTHRYHHAFTDTKKDPHSPRLLGIFYTYFPMLVDRTLNPSLVVDLLKDDFHKFIHKNYLNIILLTVLLSYVFLGAIWTLSIFVAPGALCWANIALCNILCHWGDEGDPIKHNKLLGFITFGEGYHQYHHSSPKDPNFGGKDFDVGYFFIKLIENKK